MNTFDLDDFLRVLGPVELVVAFVVGLYLGAVYAWVQQLGTRLFNTGVISGVFFLTLAIVRWFEGSNLWEVWIAAWLLYMVFASGMSVGYRSRRRYEIRKKGISSSSGASVAFASTESELRNDRR